MKFKHLFLLFSMVLFTASVSYSTPDNQNQVRTEDCISVQSTVVPAINFEANVTSNDISFYSIDIEMPRSPQVQPINDMGAIDRWCKQERIRLCTGFINNSSNPPNLNLKS